MYMVTRIGPRTLDLERDCGQPPCAVPGAMLALILAAFAQDTVATVNGVPVPAADLAAITETISDEQRGVVSNAQLVDQLVLTELLVQAARASGVDKTVAAVAQLRVAQNTTLASFQLNLVVEERTTDAKVAAWYEAHKAQFVVAEARARHILVPTQAEAQALVDQIKRGKDFAALAAASSQDPGSARDGGELGWFTRDRMVPEFGAAVFAAKAGQVLAPVQTQYGWHVIEVEELRDAVPLADAAPQIRAQLRGEIVDAYLQELRDKAVVTTTVPPEEPTLTPLTAAPDLPADAPRAGKGTKATLVVFLDMECPHCAKSEPELVKLANERKDLTVVFRHYPINGACNPAVEGERHPAACTAAAAVVCAGKKSLDMLNDLMTNSAALNDEVIANVAAAQGLSGKKWDACLAAPATKARIAKDVAAADKLGVQGTPSFYLGVDGAWWHYEGDLDALGATIDKR